MEKTYLLKLLVRVFCILCFTSSAFATTGEVTDTPPTQTPIVGGETAAEGDWPWMAGVLNVDEINNYDAQFCGASVIHQRWVLTAAHCFYSDEGVQNTFANNISILLGAYDLSLNDGQRFSVEQLIIHPNFNFSTLENDIALIQLNAATTITPVILAPPFISESVFINQASVAIGWGNTSATEEIYADKLRQVTIPIIANSLCNRPQSLDGEVSANMLCAGLLDEGGKDSCQGDSGGPLVIADASFPNGHKQVGLSSWGNECAAVNYPGVYTRISNYSDWVSAQICTAQEIPEASTVAVQVTGNQLTISWDAVDNISAYRLYYAPAPNAEVIDTLLLTQTSISGELPSGSHYFIAVQTAQGNCLGSVSNLTSFQID